MSKPFQAATWYWIADDGRIWSMPAAALVPATDTGYQAFTADGTKPTVWPRDASGQQTSASLQDVLTGYGLYADLATQQTALCADIDTQAQAQRDLYVTRGGAQAATYLLKQMQAQAAQAAQAGADAGKTAAQLAAGYPYLANEVDITVDPSTNQPATDIYGVARAVMAQASAWQPLNLAIEAMRLKTKAVINAATTAATAQTAHDGVAWPTPAATS